ncbi:hypothetical protein PV04_00895 [Phialophora macrospora]|uniref:Zn(2)-C6 fungal-type domain-containing protein n=1 Tax=Phialophora macrospora TaxID=1851006 RepID=A0A0D2GJZ6_9EURO|nr:hypothetical protein PV04_00895 [Phialophora macrospora]
MARGRQSTRSHLARARLVCVHCHTRKVKCDLENRDGGSCSSCSMHGLQCVSRHPKRVSVRQKYCSVQPKPASDSYMEHGSVGTPVHDALTLFSPTTDGAGGEERWRLNLATGATHPPYLGETSYMVPDTPSLRPDHESTTAYSTLLRNQILQIPGLTDLPSELLLGAYADNYFEYSFHRLPVVQRGDLLPENRSVPLCQAICMVGSMLRLPRGPAPLAESEQYYTRAKILTHLDDSPDYISTLKTMCLLMTWNIKGHLILTLDCAWQWIGMASRLLTQMGLHRNTSYLQMPNRAIVRRIAWCIFTQDQLVSSSMGRPTGIKLHEFDVAPLSGDDFEVINRPALLFMELARLATILGRIQDLHSRRAGNIHEECSRIIESLQQWLENLPGEVRLYDTTQRRVYHRDVSEIHIVYFITVISCLNLFGDQRRFSASTLASLVASSCATRLYEEMYVRDDVNYLLGVNTWYLMVAAVPQLLYNSVASQSDLCVQELEIITKALKQLQIKFAGATPVLNTVERLAALRRWPRVRPARSPSSEESSSGGIKFEMPELQGLFPFPASFSPRIEITLVDGLRGLEPDIGETSSQLDDFSWIFDDFWDTSQLLFDHDPGALAQETLE